MKKTAQQKAIDNRANQLNPNNPAYYKSRMGNRSKNKNKVIIVNHHHHHHHHAKKTHYSNDPSFLLAVSGGSYSR